MHVPLAAVAVILSSIFACVPRVLAQTEPRKLTLTECIEMAISRNLDLQIQKAATEASGYGLAGAYGAYSPVLNLQARRDFVSQPGNFDPQKNNPDFPYELDTDEFSGSLAGLLPFGLEYDFTARALDREAVTDFSSSLATAALYPPHGIRETNNSYAEAMGTVRQHLLRDFWYNEDRLNIVLARKDKQISQQTLRMQLLQTILAVELAYFDLISTRDSIRVGEKSVELREALLKEIRRRVEVGDLPPPDVDQAEAELQNSLTTLSAAQERYASSENLLKSLITDDFLSLAETPLEPTEILMALPPSLNRSESFQQALKNRPDLAEARLAIQKSQAVVQFRLNQLFPALDVIGRYGGLGVARSSSAALSDAIHFDDPIYYYGVVVSMPLNNVRERSDYRSSKAMRQMSELQLKKAEQAVMVLVADWVNRVQSRYTRVSSTRAARQFAEGALNNEVRKLQNGFSSSFFVLDLQEKLVTAQNAEVQAISDYNKALAHLSFAEANTLERHGINLLFDSAVVKP